MAKASKAVVAPLAEYIEKEPTRLMTDFKEWVEEKTGYEVDETTLYLGWHLRLIFQASDENKAKLAARKAEIAAAASAPKAEKAPKAAKGKAAKEEPEAAPVARRRPAAAAKAAPATPPAKAPTARRRPATA